MATSLLDSIRGYLTPDVVQRASAFLGESPSATQKAVDGAVPTLLAGMVERASSSEGAESLLHLLNRDGHSGNILQTLSGVLGGGGVTQNLVTTGQHILSMLFGSRTDALASSLASYSGLKSSSASSLLAMLAPVAMGALGREVSSRGLDASGLMTLLMNQKAELSRFLPSGLAGLLGGFAGVSSGVSAAASRVGDRVTSGVSGVARDVSSAASSAYAGAEATARGGRRWVLPLAILALLAFGAWYLLRGRGGEYDMPQSAQQTTPEIAAQAATPPNGQSGTKGTGSGPGTDTPVAREGGDAGTKGTGSAGVAASAPATPGGDAGTKGTGSAGVAGAVDASKNAVTRAAEATASGVGTAAKEVGRAAERAGSATKSAAEIAAEKTAGAAVAAGTATAHGARAVGRKISSLLLPGGRKLEVEEGSVSHNLATYLGSGGAGDVPRTFVFDHLNFQSGSTRLIPSSRDTVTELVAILKAHSGVDVRLDGYTDNTGNADANVRLSRQRAEAVKGMMTKAGVEAGRISTDGHGQDKPVATNDTPDGRQQNRRIELTVTKK